MVIEGRSMLQQESTALQALSVLLQHPTIAANQQIMCKLLQVSKDWRAAVQSSAASLTQLSFMARYELSDLSRFSRFASWLSAYPRLVHSINVGFKVGCPIDGRYHYQNIVTHLLESSLQLAAMGGSRYEAAGGGDMLHKPWKLREFSCSMQVTPRMIWALQVSTLTRVTLAGPFFQPAYVVPACLLQLTSLQHLSMGGRLTLHQRVATGLSSLSRLTYLHTRACCSDNQLPDTLHTLPVELLEADISFSYGQRSIVSADMTYLRSLRSLTLFGPLAPGSRLPSQLQSLYLGPNRVETVDSLGLTNLQQLQQLTLDDCGLDALQLQQLGQSSQLTSVSLAYVDKVAVMQTAPVWQHLPQLRNLALDLLLSMEDAYAILRHVSTLTSPIKLSLHFQSLEGSEFVDICMLDRLSCLQQLQSLDVCIDNQSDDDEYHFDPVSALMLRDALHLTALTSLTRLAMSAVVAAVDDVTLCALAVSLTKLQELEITGSQKLSVAALPAVGQLASLKRLHLANLREDDLAMGLGFLTGLTKLTELEGFSACDADALARFWAGIRERRCCL